MKPKNNVPSEELQRRTRKYTNMLLIIVIMIGVSLFSLFHGENTVQFNWTEEHVQITAPDDTIFTIVYNEIIAAELITHPDYGYCHAGGKRSGWIYGSWENDVWGTYTLCAGTNTQQCIVLRTASETFVLSYESDDITAALYDSICDIIKSQPSSPLLNSKTPVSK